MPTPTDNQIIRTKLEKTHDDGTQQKVEATGRYGERFGGTSAQNATPKIQHYGFTYHAPVGSHGYTLIPEGNPDSGAILNYEHTQYRPKNLAEAEWKLYDKWGHFLYAQEHQWYFKVGTSEIWLKDDGTIHLKGTKIILEVTDKVYIGGPDATLEVAMRGSLDNDTESNGADALVDALATKAVVK